MREKHIPYKALPHVIVVWQNLNRTPRKSKQRGFGITYSSNYSFIKEDVYVHPLSGLQKQIVRVIYENGGVASVDKIVGEVQKVWYLVNKSEGIETVECHRAIFTSLINTPVFMRDNDNEGYWKIIPSMISKEEIEAIEHETKHALDSPPIDIETNDDEEEEEIDEESNESDEDVIIEEQPPLKKLRNNSVGSSDQNQQGIKITPKNIGDINGLQQIIMEGITKIYGGKSTVENLYKYVNKYWNSLKKRDSQLSEVDCKYAVQCYVDNVITVNGKNLFTVDTQNEKDVYYKLTDYGIELMESLTTPTNTELPKLTGMQDVLMKILLTYGGICSFDQIYEEFVQNGHARGNDYKRTARALLASLSHNPPGNFRKTGDGNSWMIAPKAMNIAEQIVLENPKYSLEKIKGR